MSLCQSANPSRSAALSGLDTTRAVPPPAVAENPPPGHFHQHPKGDLPLRANQSPGWYALSALGPEWWSELLSRRGTSQPDCDCGGCPGRGCLYLSPNPPGDLAAYSSISGVHLECLIPPPMSAKDFHLLCSSIRQFGQREPIQTDLAGYLLDGRHRLAACRALEIPPIIEKVSYNWRPSPYGLTRGLQRLERYRLDLVERLQVGEELLPIIRAARRQGRTSHTGRPPRQWRHQSLKVPLKPWVPAGRTTDVLAGMLNLGRQTLERYLNLPPDLKSAVIERRQNVHQATLALQRRTRVSPDQATPPSLAC
jgi:hypothetical protein